MKYKLLVIDVDGTLLNDQKQITPHTKSALLKAQQMGVHVVLASGRPTGGILPLAQELELNNYGGYVISYNGAQIIEMQTGNLLFENLNNMNIRQVTNFPNAIDFKPCKCMLASDNEAELVGLENHWKKKLAGVADVFRSEDYFLEVVPPTIDKGNTLALLMEMLKLTREEVIAIGDGIADVPMLQLAGLGIAMGNARDSVKVCAEATTLSNEQDGVAIAIEKAILSAIRPTEIPLDQLNARGKHALMGNLGIQYTYASEERVEATMPVDERTRQPFGILHGGATLALAETVAGLGSMLIVQPDEIVVGMQVSGNHISSAHEGDTVRAVATIFHKGRSSHVWNVDIFTSTDRLVSSIRVVNSVMKKR